MRGVLDGPDVMELVNIEIANVPVASGCRVKQIVRPHKMLSATGKIDYSQLGSSGPRQMVQVYFLKSLESKDGKTSGAGDRQCFAAG